MPASAVTLASTPLFLFADVVPDDDALEWSEITTVTKSFRFAARKSRETLESLPVGSYVEPGESACICGWALRSSRILSIGEGAGGFCRLLFCDFAQPAAGARQNAMIN